MQIHGRAQRDGSTSTKCIRLTLTVPASPVCTHGLGCWGLMTDANWAMGRVTIQSTRSPYAIPHTPDIHHVPRMRSIGRRQARQARQGPGFSHLGPLAVEGRTCYGIGQAWMLGSSMQAIQHCRAARWQGLADGRVPWTSSSVSHGPTRMSQRLLIPGSPPDAHGFRGTHKPYGIHTRGDEEGERASWSG